MGGQYSIDVAGFLSTTDAVATELEVLAEAVAGGVRDLDRLTDLVAVEPGLGDALQSASGERRRTGAGAVRHGGDVVMAAGRVALAYVQADDDMADSTSRADVGTPSPRAPGVVRFGRGWR